LSNNPGSDLTSVHTGYHLAPQDVPVRQLPPQQCPAQPARQKEVCQRQSGRKESITLNKALTIQHNFFVVKIVPNKYTNNEKL
jgi:hypothetical protein